MLARDADAAAAVARSWIGQGDAENRGSRRADELSATWRDRENDTIALLTAALPYEKTVWELSQLLNAILRWLPGATRPDTALGDRLLPHALAEGAVTAQQAQVALGCLGDERLLAVVPDPDPSALAALAARTGHLDHQQLALRHPSASPDELLAALTTHAARALLPELKDLVLRRPTATLLRRLGDWGIHDSDLLGLLADAGGKDGLAVAATVAAARLGADPTPALRLLEHRLTEDGWCLEEAGRLGPAAGPLLPLVEGYFAAGYEWRRMHAAEAHWRITGDASKATPVLAALAGPLPVGVATLRTLLLIGPPYPSRLPPDLVPWATSERRVARDYGLAPAGSGRRHLDDRLRAAAREMLA